MCLSESPQLDAANALVSMCESHGWTLGVKGYPAPLASSLLASNAHVPGGTVPCHLIPHCCRVEAWSGTPALYLLCASVSSSV